LKVATPSEREIALTRVFDAPCSQVFDSITKPELIKRWGSGPSDWSFVACEIDLKVGGAWRFVLRGPDGTDMGMRGVYREVISPYRLVKTESFDDSWYPGEAIVTTLLVERNGMTTLMSTIRYESVEARDAVLRSPMEHGLAASYDRLAEILSLEEARQETSKKRLSAINPLRRTLSSLLWRDRAPIATNSGLPHFSTYYMESTK
jgi:uncharacterized protein YndB with AHSA1/START domain